MNSDVKAWLSFDSFNVLTVSSRAREGRWLEIDTHTKPGPNVGEVDVTL